MGVAGRDTRNGIKAARGPGSRKHRLAFGSIKYCSSAASSGAHRVDSTSVNPFFIRVFPSHNIVRTRSLIMCALQERSSRSESVCLSSPSFEVHRRLHVERLRDFPPAKPSYVFIGCWLPAVHLVCIGKLRLWPVGPCTNANGSNHRHQRGRSFSGSGSSRQEKQACP